MAKRNFRKSSYSGNEVNCVLVDGTLKVLGDSKAPGVEMPAPGGVPALIRFIQANRITTPAS